MAGGHVPPKVLGYQLTLFGPRGADAASLKTISNMSHMANDLGNPLGGAGLFNSPINSDKYDT